MALPAAPPRPGQRTADWLEAADEFSSEEASELMSTGSVRVAFVSGAHGRQAGGRWRAKASVAMLLATLALAAGLLALHGGLPRRSGGAEGAAKQAVALAAAAAAAAPAALPAPGLPTLFCFSVMMLGTEEEHLVRTQLQKRCSIFACDEAAVIAKEKVLLGTAEWGDVYTWKVDLDMSGQQGQYGVGGQKTNSFLNTQEFILVWNVLMDSGHLWKFNFAVKVDPDCVFFSDRLRPRLVPHQGESMYFTNCGKWASGPKLYGSVEIFSREVLHAYSVRRDECAALPWRGVWGEDYYMQKCMDTVLHAGSVLDGDIVGDKRCDPAPCTDWHKVAFHDYKSVGAYFDCWGQATGL